MIWSTLMITKNPSLRFLLALGGKKVVVVQERQDLKIYSDQKQPTNSVFVERISHALSAR